MKEISEQVKELREASDDYAKEMKLRAAYLLKQAADTIEELSANLAAVNSGRWIPCSDRMPDPGAFYLVTYKFDDEEHIRCHELYFGLSDCDEEPRWYVDDDLEDLYKPFTVIAWMPLPEAYNG